MTNGWARAAVFGAGVLGCLVALKLGLGLPSIIIVAVAAGVAVDL